MVRMLSIILLAACAGGVDRSEAPREVEEPPAEVSEMNYEVVEQGAYGRAADDYENRRAPWIEVARDRDAFDRLWTTWIGPEPPAVELEDSTALFLLVGARPTGGYGVVLSDARIEGTSLEILADLRQPGPTDIVTQAFTAPFLVLEIDSRAFDEVRWIDQGRLLASADVPSE